MKTPFDPIEIECENCGIIVHALGRTIVDSARFFKSEGWKINGDVAYCQKCYMLNLKNKMQEKMTNKEALIATAKDWLVRFKWLNILLILFLSIIVCFWQEVKLTHSENLIIALFGMIYFALLMERVVWFYKVKKYGLPKTPINTNIGGEK